MRRIPRLIVCVAVLVGTVAATAPAQAQELPPGFTDGKPVGQDDAGPAEEAPGGVAAAAVTTRYFGGDAYAVLRSTVATTTRPCPITDDGLTALVLAPVFKESSAATTPATAPSPMTLSRYDEWNGVYSTGGTPSNNYGLYAFRNPNTAYKNAFWHPGIGIWQYDTAGLGAPLTTVEAMDVGVVAGEVAELMARNYCNAAGSDLSRRYAAWRDWGNPCTLCEGFFQEMMGSSPHFANLTMVPGIGPLGGTVPRLCSIGAVSTPVPCWYVEPRVGVIQGATAWATLDPTGGSSPTVAPTPLSKPFYVIDRGATEERHWLRADTGYSIDIKASRVIGKDARPRSSQTGSGLTWTSSSDLCDITTGRGSCSPIPPVGVSAAALSVTGSTYRPASLDADADGHGDILWYNPGSGSDALWLGTGDGGFTPTSVNVGGTYDHVRTGDLDGDGDDDVLFYSSSLGKGFLWRSDGDGTFSSLTLTPGTGLVPLVLDVDADVAEEIFWYGAGSRADSLWSWAGASFQSSPRSVGGSYQPIVGDFDGNDRDDILWYAPGTASDHVWLHKVSGGYTSTPRPINGTYQWRVGDMDGDDIDDVLWYAPGTHADSLWFGAPLGAFAGKPLTVNGTYLPVVTDLFGTGRSVIMWYAPGPTSDYLWSFSASRAVDSSLVLLPGAQQPLLGPFSAAGAPGIVWYGPGSAPDAVWYR